MIKKQPQIEITPPPPVIIEETQDTQPKVEYICFDVWNSKLDKHERKCRYIEIHKT